ncbi:MAG: PD-(D/E)XK nuclease family protein, partial [Clostridiales bacterium]|nr:PD-(D/E)XK nuclease family protein [Clostridiales bacterium]
YAIPCFIDQTRNILFHPFLELIRAALEVVESDFSYRSIFRFLRSGLSGIDGADIDCLENYVLARGIRGRKQWREPWTFVLAQGGAMSDAAEGEMLRLNKVRENISEMFETLFEAFRAEHTVAEQTYALYQFIVSLEIEAKLKEKQVEFEMYAGKHRGDRTSAARAQEYAQIYKIVMELLDKVASLLGEEKLSVREYGEILDAGFDAAKVGIIPPGNDRVTIGDIERTRLNHIKVLFFVGVNDGVVPKAGSNGGIISQFEREKMAEHHLELAPGAREKVFIQKFYLYLNMTKPSDALHMTFSRVDANGKALRRSYLIGTMLHMFPALTVEVHEEKTTAEDILTPENAMQFFLEGLNDKRAGKEQVLEREEEKLWNALLNWYLSSVDFAGEAKRFLDAAYQIHTSEPIGRAVTRALYGTTLENSVTRLERFAACAFAHYLQYGLRLSERRLQEFANVDMGNIYHDALEHFAGRVRASEEYTWFNLPGEVRSQWIEESMEDAVAGAKNAGLFEDARNRYLLLRMKETLRKTVWALTLQVQKGKFVPEAFEVSFSRADDLAAIQFTLSDEEKMRLRGRIDRIDTYETDDKVYVKVIDYKSGSTKFSLLNLYHGLQLQLVVYLNAALELVEKRHPGKTAETAGIFYYHIENPMVDGTGTESEEEIRQEVLSQLKLNGLVNEEQEIYRAMDTEFAGSSSVIPVAEKADGSLKAVSSTASAQDFEVISEYVRHAVGDAGKRIMDGDVAVRPYELSDHTGCDYCPYHMVCGFDSRLSGFAYRKLEKFDSEDAILERMREEI